jgi:hypothetical protein
VKYAIKAIGFANGAECPHADHWLRSFDHDALGGIGHGVFTTKATHAKRFATSAEAMIFWNKVSTVRPLRADGRPNKPLTALSIIVEPLE